MTRHSARYWVAVTAGAAICALASGGSSAAAAVSGSGSLTGGLAPAAAGAAVPAAAGAAWGPAQDIAGAGKTKTFAALGVITCPGTGECVAAGQNILSTAENWVEVVVDERHGTWGKASAIRNIDTYANGVNSVSCVAPGDCTMAGWYSSGPDGDAWTHNPFVLTERGGAWGNALEPPGLAALNHGAEGATMTVSCPKAGYCAAGGYYTSVNAHDGNPAGGAWVVDEKNGTWGTAKPVPGITASANFPGVLAVSCWSAGNCEAGGTTASGTTPTPYYGGGQAFIAAEVNGTWKAARRIGGMSSITMLTCPAAGQCLAAGYGSIQGQCPITYGCPAAFVTERNGTWGNSRTVLSQSAALTTGSSVNALSCGSAGNCVLAGSFGLLEQKSWTWGKLRAVPGATGGVATVSCPSAGNCEAGGTYAKNDGFVIAETRGGWGKAQVETYGPVGMVSCFSPTSCGALVGAKTVSVYGYSAPVYAGVMNRAVIQSTRTTLWLSAQSLTYGHEQAERVSATVSAGLGTPAGSVLVSAGSATPCVIGLVGGRGNCTLTAAALGAGSRQLTAYYTGGALFRPSASATRTLTVLKAATTTGLTLSASGIGYGNEHSELLTVKVAPRYAGVPGGKVTVTAGSVTVCVITLAHGTGGCRLAAAELKPGSYQLTARYPGSANFLASASAKHALTITK